LERVLDLEDCSTKDVLFSEEEGPKTDLGARRLFLTGLAEGFNEGSLRTLAIGSEITFTKFVDLGSGAIDIGLLLGEIDLQANLSVEETIKADSGGELGLEASRLPGIALAMTLPEIFTEDISLPLIRILVDEFI
jgi:hypothetical protein